MTNKQIIAEFLKPPSEGGAYTDEKLAALLAHAEDGKLAFMSCCCFAGIPSAVHPLHGEVDSIGVYFRVGHDDAVGGPWLAMSTAYGELADNDVDRRTKLIPLIHAEMKRRESSRSQVEVSEVVMV